MVNTNYILMLLYNFYNDTIHTGVLFMLFKNTKIVLNILRNSAAGIQGKFYDRDKIWEQISKKHPKFTVIEYICALESLEKEGYILFPDNSHTAFRLTEKGLYYEEYQLIKLKEYLLERCFEILAVIISIIALIISILNGK